MNKQIVRTDIGVCVSHAALLNAYSQLRLTNNDGVMLYFSSLYWISGIVITISGTLDGAIRIITTEPFSPELELHLIEKYKVTFMLNGPYQLASILRSDRISKSDLSSLKFLQTGGSKVPLHIKNGIQKLLVNGNVHNGMAMTEIVCSVADDWPRSERDTIGQLADGNCVKVVDENGNRLGVNDDGELCIKTSCKFLGYYSNQQATDEAVDEEGFLKSGDIVHFDEEGYLYHVDRKKDLIKYCNFQIAPSAIDAFLSESSDIKTSCVVGIPDPIVTDLPAALVIRNEGSSITEDDVFGLVAGKSFFFQIQIK